MCVSGFMDLTLELRSEFTIFDVASKRFGSSPGVDMPKEGKFKHLSFK